MKRPPRALLLAGALLLGGCASAPPPDTVTLPAAPPAPSREADGLSRLEAQHRVRALVAEDRRHWAEAAWSWEVLMVLRPQHAPYRERAAVLQRQIQTAAAEQMGQGQAARQRGALEAASTHYLRVLALQPDHAEAADALREIERERNRRLYLGKPSRLTMSLRGALMPAAPEGEGGAQPTPP